MTTTRNSKVLQTITLLITIFSLSFPAYAKYSGGTGEPNDPYQIATAEDLIALGEDPNDYDKHFILTADIDLDPNLPGRVVFGMAVIAPDANSLESGFQGTTFTGTFDGNGNKISHLTVNGRSYLGLFGILDSGAIISNLGIESADVRGTNSYVGGLSGISHGTITTCYSSSNVSGSDKVGGLVGWNFGKISNCNATGNVSGGGPHGGLVGENWGTIDISYSTGSVNGAIHVGGLVGYNYYVPGSGLGTITSCYSSANVTGHWEVGGLVGLNELSIINCYSTGSVSGANRIGGLVGCNYNSIMNCLSTGLVSGDEATGGLIGWNSIFVDVIVSFWDIETSGLEISAGGSGKTTAELQTASTFVKWANDPVWTIDEGNDYPRLWWQKMPGIRMTNKPFEGSGSEADPYLIWTSEQMNAIGAEPNEWNKHFKLMANIDLSTYTNDEFNIIGIDPNDPFSGVFDGNGHTISNFSYSSTNADYIALFGFVEGESWEEIAEIKNLRLVQPIVDGGTGSRVGSLVGVLSYNVKIMDCCSEGGNVAGYRFVGGLVGQSGRLSIITNCHSTSNVSGSRVVGGLVGSVLGRIRNCYATGSVTGIAYIGGLVGGNYGFIMNCYFSGTVNGNEIVGGLVGDNYEDKIIAYCYSNGIVTGDKLVGGLVGSNDGYVYTSYWDTQTSGQIVSDGGAGKTTAQMNMASTFTGWGSDSAWTIDEGKDCPRLWWENMPGNAITTPAFESLAGIGTTDNPYLFQTAEEFNTIGLFPSEWNKHFKLIEDIDLSDYSGNQFNIIGVNSDYPFTGIFNGNGRTISNFSYSTQTDKKYIGIFGYMRSPHAIIKCLGLINTHIESEACSNVGSLVGYLGSDCTITECYTDSGTIRGKWDVGGLVGENSDGSISNCYSKISVVGTYDIGGLVGYNFSYVSNCYSTGSVSSTRQWSTDVGGLVGKNSGSITTSFWDINTSGQTTSAGGNGKTTDKMQTASTYLNAGWDFINETENGTENIWWMPEDDYPRLWWETE